MCEIFIVIILICFTLSICGYIVYDVVCSMKQFSEEDKENKEDE